MNTYLFNLINGLAGKSYFLDRVMIFSAKYLIFLPPLFLLYVFFQKEKGKKDFVFILFVLAISFAISSLFYIFYFHPRPFMIGLGKKLIPHKPENSFPSNHTLLLVSFSFSLFILKRYKSAFFFLILAVLVGLARIFCGVHFPFDIFGAFIIGFMGALIALFLRKKFDKIYDRFLADFLNKIFQ